MCYICIISLICTLVYFGMALGAKKMLLNVICLVKNAIANFEFPWQNNMMARDNEEEDDSMPLTCSCPNGHD